MDSQSPCLTCFWMPSIYLPEFNCPAGRVFNICAKMGCGPFDDHPIWMVRNNEYYLVRECHKHKPWTAKRGEG